MGLPLDLIITFKGGYTDVT